MSKASEFSERIKGREILRPEWRVADDDNNLYPKLYVSDDGTLWFGGKQAMSPRLACAMARWILETFGESGA